MHDTSCRGQRLFALQFTPQGGSGTRPWWLALLACGGAYWPLALEPSAKRSRHPHYCGHPHCRGHPRGGTSEPAPTPTARRCVSARCPVWHSVSVRDSVWRTWPVCLSVHLPLVSDNAHRRQFTPTAIRQCPIAGHQEESFIAADVPEIASHLPAVCKGDSAMRSI